MADSSPPDPDRIEDDGVEPPPGRSLLDGILANLARRWPTPAPAGEAGTETGGRR